MPTVRRASTGTEVTYSEDSNRFHKWLSGLPQGSFKVLIGAVIAMLTTLAVLVAPYFEAMFCAIRYRSFPQVPTNVACSHLEINEGALWVLFAIIAGFVGFSSADFLTKRKTYQPSPPLAVDVEDARAGAKVTDAAPTRVEMSRSGDPQPDGRTSAKDDRPRLTDNDDGTL